jgi:hypothetical protein
MSSRHSEETLRRNDAAEERETEIPSKLTWHQIVEWTDEDLARWRDAHRRPKAEAVS